MLSPFVNDDQDIDDPLILFAQIYQKPGSVAIYTRGLGFKGHHCIVFSLFCYQPFEIVVAFLYMSKPESPSFEEVL